MPALIPLKFLVKYSCLHDGQDGLIQLL